MQQQLTRAQGLGYLKSASATSEAVSNRKELLSVHSLMHSHIFEAMRLKLHLNQYYWSSNQQILLGHSVY